MSLLGIKWGWSGRLTWQLKRLATQRRLQPYAPRGISDANENRLVLHLGTWSKLLHLHNLRHGCVSCSTQISTNNNFIHVVVSEVSISSYAYWDQFLLVLVDFSTRKFMSRAARKFLHNNNFIHIGVDEVSISSFAHWDQSLLVYADFSTRKLTYPAACRFLRTNNFIHAGGNGLSISPCAYWDQFLPVHADFSTKKLMTSGSHDRDVDTPTCVHIISQWCLCHSDEITLFFNCAIDLRLQIK